MNRNLIRDLLILKIEKIECLGMLNFLYGIEIIIPKLRELYMCLVITGRYEFYFMIR